MNKADGGPAFPTPESHGDDFEGMSLRDYFAGKALGGLLSLGDGGEIDAMVAEFVAEESYILADAMLAKRAK